MDNYDFLGSYSEFNMFDGANSGLDMGGAGVLAPTNYAPSIPYLDNSPSLFNAPLNAPDGAIMVGDRTSSSFWGFDQSKITASLSNVLGSVVEAGAKTAVQKAAGTINTQANSQGALSGFFQNFRSTSTGAQINAGANAYSVQNFLMNPTVWLFGALGIVLVVILKFKR